MNQCNNIVLIGMPGVGKSTVGVLLAKEAGRSFIDTDVAIQAAQGRPLQQIIDSDGIAAFCRIEEACILALDCRRHVIATGGSAVYSEPAMRHLKAAGTVVHLDLELGQIESRIRNLRTRGIVMEKGQSLAALYVQRQPLYARWADATIDCRGKTQDEIVAAIVASISTGL